MTKIDNMTTAITLGAAAKGAHEALRRVPANQKDLATQAFNYVGYRKPGHILVFKGAEMTAEEITRQVKRYGYITKPV